MPSGPAMNGGRAGRTEREKVFAGELYGGGAPEVMER